VWRSGYIAWLPPLTATANAAICVPAREVGHPFYLRVRDGLQVARQLRAGREALLPFPRRSSRSTAVSPDLDCDAHIRPHERLRPALRPKSNVICLQRTLSCDGSNLVRGSTGRGPFGGVVDLPTELPLDARPNRDRQTIIGFRFFPRRP
jgi:hypothetical protein